MKLWEQMLRSLASNEYSRKVGSLPEISSVIINFITEEIYPRILSLKNELTSLGCNVIIFPESIDKITTASQIVGLLISNKNIEYSLKLHQENNLDIAVEVIEKNGHQVLSTIAIDGSPNPPTILLEKCIEEFKGAIN